MSNPKGKRKKEETILAEFKVGKYTCQYDGLCWMVNESGGNNKQLYYATLEAVALALLNKTAAAKGGSKIGDLVQAISEAKHEILGAIRLMDIPQKHEE